MATEIDVPELPSAMEKEGLIKYQVPEEMDQHFEVVDQLVKSEKMPVPPSVQVETSETGFQAAALVSKGGSFSESPLITKVGGKQELKVSQVEEVMMGEEGKHVNGERNEENVKVNAAEDTGLGEDPVIYESRQLTEEGETNTEVQDVAETISPVVKNEEPYLEEKGIPMGGEVLEKAESTTALETPKNIEDIAGVIPKHDIKGEEDMKKDAEDGAVGSLESSTGFKPAVPKMETAHQFGNTEEPLNTFGAQDNVAEACTSPLEEKDIHNTKPTEVMVNEEENTTIDAIGQASSVVTESSDSKDDQEAHAEIKSFVEDRLDKPHVSEKIPVVDNAASEGAKDEINTEGEVDSLQLGKDDDKISSTEEFNLTRELALEKKTDGGAINIDQTVVVPASECSNETKSQQQEIPAESSVQHDEPGDVKMERSLKMEEEEMDSSASTECNKIMVSIEDNPAGSPEKVSEAKPVEDNSNNSCASRDEDSEKIVGSLERVTENIDSSALSECNGRSASVENDLLIENMNDVSEGNQVEEKASNITTDGNKPENEKNEEISKAKVEDIVTTTSNECIEIASTKDHSPMESPEEVSKTKEETSSNAYFAEDNREEENIERVIKEDVKTTAPGRCTEMPKSVNDATPGSKEDVPEASEEEKLSTTTARDDELPTVRHIPSTELNEKTDSAEDDIINKKEHEVPTTQINKERLQEGEQVEKVFNLKPQDEDKHVDANGESKEEGKEVVDDCETSTVGIVMAEVTHDTGAEKPEEVQQLYFEENLGNKHAGKDIEEEIQKREEDHDTQITEFSTKGEEYGEIPSNEAASTKISCSTIIEDAAKQSFLETASFNGEGEETANMHNIVDQGEPDKLEIKEISEVMDQQNTNASASDYSLQAIAEDKDKSPEDKEKLTNFPEMTRQFVENDNTEGIQQESVENGSVENFQSDGNNDEECHVEDFEDCETVKVVDSIAKETNENVEIPDPTMQTSSPKAQESHQIESIVTEEDSAAEKKESDEQKDEDTKCSIDRAEIKTRTEEELNVEKDLHENEEENLIGSAIPQNEEADNSKQVAENFEEVDSSNKEEINMEETKEDNNRPTTQETDGERLSKETVEMCPGIDFQNESENSKIIEESETKGGDESMADDTRDNNYSHDAALLKSLIKDEQFVEDETKIRPSEASAEEKNELDESSVKAELNIERNVEGKEAEERGEIIHSTALEDEVQKNESGELIQSSDLNTAKMAAFTCNEGSNIAATLKEDLGQFAEASDPNEGLKNEFQMEPRKMVEDLASKDVEWQEKTEKTEEKIMIKDTEEVSGDNQVYALHEEADKFTFSEENTESVISIQSAGQELKTLNSKEYQEEKIQMEMHGELEAISAYEGSQNEVPAEKMAQDYSTESTVDPITKHVITVSMKEEVDQIVQTDKEDGDVKKQIREQERASMDESDIPPSETLEEAPIHKENGDENHTLNQKEEVQKLQKSQGNGSPIETELIEDKKELTSNKDVEKLDMKERIDEDIKMRNIEEISEDSNIGGLSEETEKCITKEELLGNDIAALSIIEESAINCKKVLTEIPQRELREELDQVTSDEGTLTEVSKDNITKDYSKESESVDGTVDDLTVSLSEVVHKTVQTSEEGKNNEKCIVKEDSASKDDAATPPSVTGQRDHLDKEKEDENDILYPKEEDLGQVAKASDLNEGLKNEFQMGPSKMVEDLAFEDVEWQDKRDTTEEKIMIKDTKEVSGDNQVYALLEEADKFTFTEENTESVISIQSAGQELKTLSSKKYQKEKPQMKMHGELEAISTYEDNQNEVPAEKMAEDNSTESTVDPITKHVITMSMKEEVDQIIQTDKEDEDVKKQIREQERASMDELDIPPSEILEEAPIHKENEDESDTSNQKEEVQKLQKSRGNGSPIETELIEDKKELASNEDVGKLDMKERIDEDIKMRNIEEISEDSNIGGLSEETEKCITKEALLGNDTAALSIIEESAINCKKVETEILQREMQEELDQVTSDEGTLTEVSKDNITKDYSKESESVDEIVDDLTVSLSEVVHDTVQTTEEGKDNEKCTVEEDSAFKDDAATPPSVTGRKDHLDKEKEDILYPKEEVKEEKSEHNEDQIKTEVNEKKKEWDSNEAAEEQDMKEMTEEEITTRDIKEDRTIQDLTEEAVNVTTKEDNNSTDISAQSVEQEFEELEAEKPQNEIRRELVELVNQDEDTLKELSTRSVATDFLEQSIVDRTNDDMEVHVPEEVELTTSEESIIMNETTSRDKSTDEEVEGHNILQVTEPIQKEEVQTNANEFFGSDSLDARIESISTEVSSCESKEVQDHHEPENSEQEDVGNIIVGVTRAIEGEEVWETKILQDNKILNVENDPSNFSESIGSSIKEHIMEEENNEEKSVSSLKDEYATEETAVEGVSGKDKQELEATTTEGDIIQKEENLDSAEPSSKLQFDLETEKTDHITEISPETSKIEDEENGSEIMDETSQSIKQVTQEGQQELEEKAEEKLEKDDCIRVENADERAFVLSKKEEKENEEVSFHECKEVQDHHKPENSEQEDVGNMKVGATRDIGGEDVWETKALQDNKILNAENDPLNCSESISSDIKEYTMVEENYGEKSVSSLKEEYATEETTVEWVSGKDKQELEATTTEGDEIQMEENLDSAEPSSKLQCDLESETTDHIPEVDQATRKIEDEENGSKIIDEGSQSIKQVCQEGQQELEEKAEDNSENDDSIKVGNADETTRAFVLSKKGQKEDERVGEETIKVAQDDKSTVRELQDSITADDSVKRVKEYSAPSSEYLKATCFNEQAKTVDSESQKEMEPPVNKSLEEDKVEREGKEKQLDPSTVTPVEEFPELMDKKILDEAESYSGRNSATTLPEITAETSLEEAQKDDKPEQVSVINSDENIEHTVEAEASPQDSILEEVAEDANASHAMLHHTSDYHEDEMKEWVTVEATESAEEVKEASILVHEPKNLDEEGMKTNQKEANSELEVEEETSLHREEHKELEICQRGSGLENELLVIPNKHEDEKVIEGEVKDEAEEALLTTQDSTVLGLEAHADEVAANQTLKEESLEENNERASSLLLKQHENSTDGEELEENGKGINVPKKEPKVTGDACFWEDSPLPQASQSDLQPAIDAGTKSLHDGGNKEEDDGDNQASQSASLCYSDSSEAVNREEASQTQTNSALKSEEPCLLPYSEGEAHDTSEEIRSTEMTKEVEAPETVENVTDEVPLEKEDLGEQEIPQLESQVNRDVQELPNKQLEEAHETSEEPCLLPYSEGEAHETSEGIRCTEMTKEVEAPETVENITDEVPLEKEELGKQEIPQLESQVNRDVQELPNKQLEEEASEVICKPCSEGIEVVAEDNPTQTVMAVNLEEQDKTPSGEMLSLEQKHGTPDIEAEADDNDEQKQNPDQVPREEYADAVEHKEEKESFDAATVEHKEIEVQDDEDSQHLSARSVTDEICFQNNEEKDEHDISKFSKKSSPEDVQQEKEEVGGVESKVEAEDAECSTGIQKFADEPESTLNFDSTETAKKSLEFLEVPSSEAPIASEESEPTIKHPDGGATSLISEEDNKGVLEATEIMENNADREVIPEGEELANNCPPATCGEGTTKESHQEYVQDDEEGLGEETTTKEILSKELCEEIKKNNGSEMAENQKCSSIETVEHFQQVPVEDEEETKIVKEAGKQLESRSTEKFAEASETETTFLTDKEITMEQDSKECHNSLTGETSDTTPNEPFKILQTPREAELLDVSKAAIISTSKGIVPEVLQDKIVEYVEGVEEGEKDEGEKAHKLSLFDMMQRSTKERQAARECSEQNEPTATKEESEVLQTEAPKTEKHKSDEEKDEEYEEEVEEGEEHKKEGLVMVEAYKDLEVKAPHHKKPHNILSGMGSRVKHSISKVKKAITGKSSHSKQHSPK